MYRFRSVSDDRWEIVDEDDQVRFVGTPRECEELLDRAENIDRKCSWLQALVDRLLNPLREPQKPPKERPTSVGS
jgi:hypothetical protein